MIVDVAELVEAATFLSGFRPWQLARLAGVLLPAAEVGAAGPYSLLALRLIADEVAERLPVAA